MLAFSLKSIVMTSKTGHPRSGLASETTLAREHSPLKRELLPAIDRLIRDRPPP